MIGHQRVLDGRQDTVASGLSRGRDVTQKVALALLVEADRDADVVGALRQGRPLDEGVSLAVGAIHQSVF